MNKLFKKVKNSNEGFTLVELIVVIAIIGILSGIMLPKFTGFMAKGKKAEVQSDIRQIYTACTAYFAENGKYPDDKEDIKDYVVISELGTGTATLTETPDTTTDVIITYVKVVKGESFTATCTTNGEIDVKKTP